MEYLALTNCCNLASDTVDSVIDGDKFSHDFTVTWIDWSVNETESESKLVVGQIELHEVDRRVRGLTTDTLSLRLDHLSESDGRIRKYRDHATKREECADRRLESSGTIVGKSDLAAVNIEETYVFPETCASFCFLHLIVVI